MKKVFFIISGIAVLACYSCTSDLVLDPPTPVVDLTSPQRLAKDSMVLSLDDAVLLTDLYGVDTKSSKTVTDVIPIKDSDGDVVIYAVNYNDGYLLVSAYKTMPPILAEIQHGSFSEDTENIMIETLRDQASIHKFDEMSVELTMAWSMYEDTVLPEIADTKAYGDVYGAIAAKMQEWRNEGYNVYRLDQCPPGLLQWEYQMMIDEAACYERDGYNYMTYSYITERVECQQWQGGPHMNTTWGGQYPYYPTSGLAYRSAAVSVGQMRKYYHPNVYPWSLCPNSLGNTPNSVLSSALSDLNGSLVSAVANQGLQDMQWVRQYLSGILSCSNLVSHSTSTAMSKFPYGSSSGKPFVMDGLTSSGVYSVWCCDGGRRDNYHDDYCLWVLADSSYPDFDFEMVGSFSKNPFDWYYLHMNWGNNGVNNGWYRDDNYSSTTTRRAVYIN